MADASSSSSSKDSVQCRRIHGGIVVLREKYTGIEIAVCSGDATKDPLDDYKSRGIFSRMSSYRRKSSLISLLDSRRPPLRTINAGDANVFNVRARENHKRTG